MKLFKNYVTREFYDSDNVSRDREIERLYGKYWELYRAHKRLLDYLELEEHETQKKIEIRSTKGDSKYAWRDPREWMAKYGS